MNQPTTASIPQSRSILARDVADITAGAHEAGWDASYHQVSPGKFGGVLRANIRPGLVISDQRFQQELVIRAAPPKGMFAVVVATSYLGPSIFQGQRLAASQVILMSPGSDDLLRSPKDMTLSTVSISSQRLDQALRTQSNCGLAETLKAATAHELTPEKTRLIRSLVQESLAETASDVEPLQNRMRSGQLENLLIQTVASGLAGSRIGEPLALARRNRTKYVRRASDYIEDHLRDGVRLQALTLAAGVSLRTLEYAFQEVLDIGLYEYIKKRRLNEARRELSLRTTGTLTVSRVAQDYGFTHLGLFAQSYSLLFGELPSQTLNCARSPLSGGIFGNSSTSRSSPSILNALSF